MNVTAIMCQRPVRDRTRTTTVTASATGGIAILAVLLRTVDTLIDGHFGFSDACALFAGLCSIPMNTLFLYMAPAGFGRDTWTLPFENIYSIAKVRCVIFLLESS